MISTETLKHDITEQKVGKAQNGYPQSRGPSPNRGASVPDFKAVAGNSTESQEAWRKARGIDRSKQVKIVKLSHMRYQHPDMNVITTFLRDFGMHSIKKTDTQRWFRGYGPDQYVYYLQQGPKKFLGGTFEVESKEELEKVKKIPNIKILNDIHEMTDAPGGGYLLTIEDPEGFPVNFVCDQAPVTEQRRKPGKIVVNDETDKPRQRAFQRFEPGPAEVHKLGHFGLNVTDFPRTSEWYARYFNIVPSDMLYVTFPDQVDEHGNPKRVDVAMFAHIDRGQDLVDHHTMFLTSLSPDPEASEYAKSKHVHHCSFEIHDFDTQALGHKWLAQKGYKSVWGVGRHILGSQVFDYWWDPNGFMVEHYADGDLVNENTPVGYGPAEHEGLAVWGPEVPADFLE